MAFLRTPHSNSFCVQPPISGSKHRASSYLVILRPGFGFSHVRLSWTPPQSRNPKLVVRATEGSEVSGDVDQNDRCDAVVATAMDSKTEKDSSIAKLQGSIAAFPPIVLTVRREAVSKIAIGVCVATVFLVFAVRAITARKSRDDRTGSVADLVRRGQLRSDRRGISKPLKYDDPFNNPLVRVGKGNSTVEMCGKVYRLAPVTLTEDEQAVHQRRRSRAYQWKRPTIFLKEGDSIPPDIDPDTVRWIPANHPFATTVSDIDEGLAQSNVRQKHGVPFRIQAEHEALQKKLEALQGDQKLSKLSIDPSNARDFERAFRSPERKEESVSNENAGSSKDSFQERPPNSSGTGATSSE